MNEGLLGPRMFAISGNMAFPLTPLSEKDFDALPKSQTNPTRSPLAAMPVYFCPGRGVWPNPANEITIVEEIERD